MFNFMWLRFHCQPYMDGQLDWVRRTVDIIVNILRFLGIIIAVIYICDGLNDTIEYISYNKSHSADTGLTFPKALEKFLIPNFVQAMIYLIITGFSGVALKLCLYFVYLLDLSCERKRYEINLLVKSEHDKNKKSEKSKSN